MLCVRKERKIWNKGGGGKLPPCLILIIMASWHYFVRSFLRSFPRRRRSDLCREKKELLLSFLHPGSERIFLPSFHTHNTCSIWDWRRNGKYDFLIFTPSSARWNLWTDARTRTDFNWWDFSLHLFVFRESAPRRRSCFSVLCLGPNPLSLSLLFGGW